MYQFVERHAYSFTVKQSCFSNLLKVISSGLHFALERQLVAWRFSRGRDFTWLSFATEEYGKSILRRKKSTGRSLVFREARAAYRVRALCARSTYLLGARITVNNGRCTFFVRVDQTNRRVRKKIGEIGGSFTCLFLSILNNERSTRVAFTKCGRL